MILPIAAALGLSLAVTEAAEFIAAFVLGVRREGWPVVLLVNLMTNPPYVLLILILGYLLPKPAIMLIMVLCEFAIFIVEAFLYRKYLKAFSHPYLLSAAANLASIAAGILVSQLR